MATAATPAPPPHLNGTTAAAAAAAASFPQAPDAPSHSSFYESLFRLQEEVLTGKHPRIHLPVAALDQLASRLPRPSLSSASRQPVNGTPYSHAQSYLPSASHAASSNPAVATSLPAPSASQRPLPAKPPSSGINPVLLTKSDDLVRAEIQLKRQRIEREIKDQYDAKKSLSRDKDFGLDAESRFDVSDILVKALELVKPISGLTSSANQNSPSSESFDENSYYSSQANSWTPDHPNGTAPPPVSKDKGKQPVIELDSASDEPSAPARDVHLDDADYDPAADVQMIEPAYPANTDLAEQGDSDYSPPPADSSAGRHQAADSRQRGYNLHPARANAAGSSLSAQEIPVIRNHIRAPVAPQPSRISPLATARKQRQVGRTRNNGQVSQPISNASSPRQQDLRGLEGMPSASGSHHQSHPKQGRVSPQDPLQGSSTHRKRRRETDHIDNRQNTGKRVARSPPAQFVEPYIKPEPVSPQPLGLIQEQHYASRHEPLLADEVDVISPRDGRVHYYREVNSRQHPRAYEVEELSSPTVVRTSSRTAYRLVQRDDQDLRRVASLQYARRPYSPGLQPIGYQDAPGIRSASHSYVEPPPHPPLYRSGSIRPDHMNRPQSPPVYIDDGYRASHTPLAMGPPPARPVFIDEQGNRYYAAPQESPLQLPRMRRIDGEVGPERALSRAPTRETVVYENDDNMRLQHPPSRRYVEPHADYIDQHAYRPSRAYSMRPSDGIPREVQYLPAERPQAPATVVYEEMPPPREYGGRAYSTRPEMVRQELPVEYISRHESVQPGYMRRAEPHPLYVAEPQPQHRRYMDEDSQEGYGASGDSLRRSVYRY